MCYVQLLFIEIHLHLFLNLVCSQQKYQYQSINQQMLSCLHTHRKTCCQPMCCKPSRKANSDGIQTHPSYFTRCSLVTRKIWHTSLFKLIHFIPEPVYCIGIKINSLYCFNFVQEKNIILSKKKILKCVSVQCESYIKVKANLHLYSMYYM